MAIQTVYRLLISDTLTSSQLSQLSGKPGIIEDENGYYFSEGDVFMLLNNNSNTTVSVTVQAGVRHYISGAIFIPSPRPKKPKWEITASGVHSSVLLLIAQFVFQRYRSNPDVLTLKLKDENNEIHDVFINSYTMPSDVLTNTYTGVKTHLNPMSLELEEV